MEKLIIIPIVILVIVNLIITIYLDLLLKKMDKSKQSRILIALIYPLLGTVISSILIIFS